MEMLKIVIDCYIFVTSDRYYEKTHLGITAPFLNYLPVMTVFLIQETEQIPLITRELC